MILVYVGFAYVEVAQRPEDVVDFKTKYKNDLVALLFYDG